ncbi:MAG: methylated-DNA--[protein]-cysteine S-methyltransferase [Phycisphaerales bacterium]|jgi:methylated-DNA-[protein]-cysteine S-methyltransferase|nr:methylated-DNA--[protein]-cysteine S-methyltransferase [Phycisphaerales bacterium]
MPVPRPPFARRVIDSPLGPIAIDATALGVCSISFGVRPARQGMQPDDVAAALPILDHAARELAEYFAGSRRNFAIPLDAPGTEFQHRVWLELARIPMGETISYQELARRCGDINASRAVGAANGANPVAIVVPCHRVLAKDGTLHGYAGGLDKKRALLDHEFAVTGAMLGATRRLVLHA